MDNDELFAFTGLNPDKDGVYQDAVQSFSVFWSKTSDEVTVAHPDGRMLKLTREECAGLSLMLGKNI